MTHFRMKKLFIRLASVLAILPALVACSSEGTPSVVEGTLVGSDNVKIYLEQNSLSSSQITDSAVVKPNGSFRLQGAIQTEPTFYSLRLSDGRAMTVLLDSAQTLRLSLDASAPLLVRGARFENSPRNENLQKIQVGASDILAGLKNGGAPDSLRRVIANYKEDIRRQILSDPQSMVGYYAVFQTVMGSRVFDVMNRDDQKVFSAAATSLRIAYPRSEQVNHLCDYILQARAQARAIARRDSLLQSATTSNSPDLNLPNRDGQQVALSSLHGKNVILSFWASDSRASRQMNAQLRKLYKKYHDKGLEIYSVSFDTSRVLWEEASDQDGITWHNVCDLAGAMGIASRVYNVTQIPANYILSTDGTLIGKDLFGTRLDEKMSELFK